MNSQPEVQVELVVMRLHRHGRRLTLPVVALVVLAAAGGFWVGSLPDVWMNWAAGLGAAALALLLGVGPLLSWLTSRVTITSRRVIVRQGFFVHRRIEVPMSRVREVRSRRGPVQRMFGSGDIELLVGPDNPTVLRDLPGPDLVIDALQELIEHNFEPGVVAAGGSTGGFQRNDGGLGRYGAPASDATTVLPRQ